MRNFKGASLVVGDLINRLYYNRTNSNSPMPVSGAIMDGYEA
jgi:hypothetical protein